MLGFRQLMVVAAVTAVTAGSVAAQGDPSLRSWPKDDTPYVRGIVPEDYGPGLGARGSLPSASAVFIVDTVVRHPGTEAPVDLVLDDPPPLPVFQVRILEPAPVPAGLPKTLSERFQRSSTGAR